MAPDAFADGLAGEAQAAAMPGEAVFHAQRCGACHTLRATRTEGGIGPDLTIREGRRSIAGGTLAWRRAACGPDGDHRRPPAVRRCPGC